MVTNRTPAAEDRRAWLRTVAAIPTAFKSAGIKATRDQLDDFYAVLQGAANDLGGNISKDGRGEK